MSVAVLPPEVISGQIYSGPGSAPLLDAATAWDGLSAELQSAAASYGSIVEGLVNESWTGPSSASMAAAAAPFVAWMSVTAARAKATANQARVAAGAFETALGATVPPDEVAANRAQLQTLVASNIVGQNTAAIAANEAQYGEMWAQDAAAMLAYAGSSAQAANLDSFTPAPQTTDPSGSASQAAAVGQSSALNSATSSATRLSSATSSPPQPLLDLLKALADFAAFANIGMGAPNFGMGEFKFFWTPPVTALPDMPAKAALGAGLGARSAAAFTSSVSAGVGDANMVGKLSVPPSWAGATPAIRLAANGLPVASLAAAPAAAIPGSLLNEMALGSLTGGALGDTPRIVSASATRVGGKGAKAVAEPVKLDDVIARLQKYPDSVQHWKVDKAGLDDLLDQLSKKPGIHTVHVSKGRKPQANAPDSSMGSR
ncbi:PPE family protein [Mycobacterium shigaense]|uniref:Putative PPE family protein PPE33 n=1 Tax=Mycobacterium shigaense TaxID=722731 RepID=A0A1Z4EFN3_9MYCO|nr:PPE family protein [Mycobacterium shigaense]MEA1124803.1 PPE family protein [Mycobacterium shigaense]PRI16481.1 hypothetical protein B2J96_06845 [Mycobacterium shigaense]BAX91756.1 putative PPE family protein PPE33 [Mycobacterium shigaense]